MQAGLCARCVNARKVKGARSVFVMCALAQTDPRFPRYPALPVLSCSGFRPSPPPADAGAGRTP